MAFSTFRDERFIKKKFGNKEHFLVPKGYFDKFSIRSSYEASGFQARFHSIWYRYRAAGISSVAACLLVGVLVFGSLSHKHLSVSSSGEALTNTSVSHFVSSMSMDDVMNYSMMDTGDMYSYMSDSE